MNEIEELKLALIQQYVEDKTAEEIAEELYNGSGTIETIEQIVSGDAIVHGEINIWVNRTINEIETLFNDFSVTDTNLELED